MPAFPLFIDETEEMREYLRGVLYSDSDFLLADEPDMDEIDVYGTGNKAFWRGVLEGGGYLGMTGIEEVRRHPRVELKASTAILEKLIAFVQEDVERRCGITWKWDDNGRLSFQARGGFIRATGSKAQTLVMALYLGQSVGRSSCRRIADSIVAWVPRR